MIQSALQFGADSYPAGFWRWFNANYRIYDEFEKRALEMARTGRRRYSAKTLFEVLRWHTDLKDSDEQFSLNNNYTSGCARLFMERHGKDLPGFFQLRDSLGRDA